MKYQSYSTFSNKIFIQISYLFSDKKNHNETLNYFGVPL